MSSVTYPQSMARTDPTFVRAAASRSLTLKASHTAVWLGVCAIAMSFAALTSALIVRQGTGMDWKPFVLPPILYLNTVLLLTSSFTLELARKHVAAEAAKSQSEMRLLSRGRKWLYVTLGLALLFVLGQTLAWRNLEAQGLFLATNPSCSFFYVFTALHGLHVLGGVLGLLYANRQLTRGFLFATVSPLSVAAVYWHFMGILWIYLFLILRIRI
jgi:cytochrome c oxidase subunit III